MADNYMPNPQMRRAAAKFGGASKPKPQKPSNAAGMHHGEEVEHAHKHVIHHPSGHENPSPGKYHSELHHADGQVEHADHDSYDEAVEHGRPEMEADGEEQMARDNAGEGGAADAGNDESGWRS